MRPNDLNFDDGGLLPAIVQDAATGEVLMLAWCDAEAVKRTLETKTTWFWSRSRNEYWNKGATSGNLQHVVEVRYDCDADALLMSVRPDGPACHTGERTCFYRAFDTELDAAT
ncbi:MAG TPA: phosphoribosyl-AMP cyclohydrolase [Actinomycetota bacterium]|nr:phosphoribosyl-AMP cyclohydrolase [Actinomycetota bacterium]